MTPHTWFNTNQMEERSTYWECSVCHIRVLSAQMPKRMKVVVWVGAGVGRRERFSCDEALLHLVVNQ